MWSDCLRKKRPRRRSQNQGNPGQRRYTQSTKQIQYEDVSYQEKNPLGEYPSEDESEIYHLHQLSGKRAFKVLLCVNEKNIEFEIDTGSGLSIISEFMQKEIFNKAALLQTNVVLKTYSGEHLKVLGRLPVVIKHHGGVYNDLYIYVVQGNGTALLGRDLLSKMKIDWYSVNKVDNGLNTLCEQYSCLFAEKLGKMKDFQAKIRLKEGATPKFAKARNVPFALQDAANAERDRLESEGILNSIPYSEWASPVVIVAKPDGHIRICADYKRTVNPYIEAEQYPLPTAEEVFNKMKGGQKFSKLDLTTAYLQVELHP